MTCLRPSLSVKLSRLMSSALVLAVLFGGSLVATSIIADPARAESSFEAGSASEFIDRLGETAIGILADKQLTQQMRSEKFREILLQRFDVPRVGRFALGLHWRRANEQQRDDYIALFKRYIVETYTARLGGYSGEVLSVTKEVPGNKKQTIVYSQINRAEGPPIRLNWRVRTADGERRVIDVQIEGISMAQTMREEFGSVIQNNGGKIEALMARLEKKLAGGIEQNTTADNSS